MKLYYLANFTTIGKGIPGVEKKINDQLTVFKEQKIDVIKIDVKRNFWNKVLYRLPFASGIHLCLDDVEHGNYLYIRNFGFDRKFIKTLKVLKESKDMKLLLELPTYPYDSELNLQFKFYNFFMILKDKLYRKKLKNYVDRIVTYSKDDEIFGVPTITTINGIIFNKAPLRIIKNERRNNDIHLIAVASLANWHGYDRLLKGLGEYYKNGGTRKIIFHLVGEGSVLEDYKKIINECNLQDKVIIYGRKKGADLDKIYNKCDIGIECLGIHRKDLSLSSSLKSREYSAKGLPIVTSCKIDIFPADYQYILNFPADESFIDIEKIIGFYDQIYQCPEDYKKVAQEIRDYAKEKCDMEVTLKPVIDYICGGENY